MPDIFDEVSEDLRAERMARLMKRYGGLFAGLALLVVLGVAGHQGWRWYEARQAAQAAAAYLAASDAAAAEGADPKAAAARFAALAAESPPGYRTLARLRAAAALAEGGDRDAALAQWDALSRDAAVEPLFRDLATLLWAMHALDGGDAAAIEARLAPLSAEGNAWRASAAEVRALAAIRRGDAEAARRTLTALASDAQLPSGIRDRAGRLLSGLGG